MSASQWELLNLDVDTILKMPSEVEALTNLSHQVFMGIMGGYLYESIGAQEFARRHMLTQSACVIVPSTAHISLTKAVTILGLGRESLVTVAVDEDARMDVKGWCIFLYYVILVATFLQMLFKFVSQIIFSTVE